LRTRTWPITLTSANDLIRNGQGERYPYVTDLQALPGTWSRRRLPTFPKLAQIGSTSDKFQPASSRATQPHALLSHLCLVVKLIVSGLFGSLSGDKSTQLFLLLQLYLETSFCCIIDLWLKREVTFSVREQCLHVAESMFILSDSRHC